MPVAGANSRDVFASSSSTTTATTCATGTCTTFQPSDWYQFQNTYTAAPSSPPSWDAVYDIAVSGEQAGSSATLCSMATAVNGPSVSCSGWSDSGSSASLPASLQVGTSSWVASGPYSFVITSGGNTEITSYVVEQGQLSPVNQLASIDCASATSCSLNVPSVQYGDAVAVLVEYPYGDLNSFYDTFSTPLALESAANVGTAQTVSSYYGHFATSGSDQFTLTLTAAGHADMQVFELQGFFTDFVVTGSDGAGSGTSLAAGSTSFSGYAYFCASALGQGSNTYAFTAGTAYTLFGANSEPGTAQYSITASSPTTYPASLATTSSWGDAGLCIARSHVSPADVWLLQGTGGGPPGNEKMFYINRYEGSYLQALQTSSAPTLVSPVTTPEVEMSVGAKLLTIWVGTSYYETLIPSSNNTFWLFAPSLMSAYTLDVQDLSGVYGPGATISITTGGRTYSSGYTDASDAYQLWMPQGYYTVTLQSGSNTYITTVSLPPITGSTVTVQILKETVSGDCQGCSTGSHVGFTSGNTALVFIFNDTARGTTSVTYTLYVTNGSGRYSVSTQTFSSGPYGSIGYTIPCNDDNCNASIAGELSMTVTSVGGYGTSSRNLAPAGGGLFHTSFGIPSNILGFSLAFGGGPDSPTPLSMFVWFVVLIAAATFGAYSSKFGVVPVAALAAVFSMAGWIALGGAGAATFLIAVAVMSFIGYLNQGGK